MPYLPNLSSSIEHERVSKQAELSRKTLNAYFYLQGVVVPYQEDMKPPTQYHNIFENQTDFLRESWMRDKKLWRRLYIRLSKTLLRLSSTETGP